jgi:hypothetical protein
MAGDIARSTFAVDLQSNIPQTAAGVASALERLKSNLEGDTQALRGMQLALGRLKGSGAVAASTIKELRDKIAATKASIAQSQASYIRLGGSFEALRPSAKAAATGFDELKSSLQNAGGPLASLLPKFASLSTLAGAGMVGVLVAVAAAIAAVGVAAGAAVAGLVRYGIASADARRSELLRLEGLSKLRNYWGELVGFTRKADSGSFLQRTIDSVAASVALGREQVVGLADEFYRAGLRGSALQAAVEGAGIALATQGEAGKAQFKALALNAMIFGGSVRKAADDIKARLGGVAKAQLLSIGSQWMKLKENFAGLFRDVKLDGALGALKQVTDLFSQSTTSGRALKVLAEGLLQPLANWVANHGLIVKRFFQGLVIGALLVGLAVLDVRDRFREMLGGGVLENLDYAKLALHAGMIAAGALAGALAMVATAAAIAVAPFVFLAAAGLGALHLLKDTVDWFGKIDWSTLGSRIIDGVVGGLQAGYQRVKGAISSLAETVMKGFTYPLQIHSPSRVFYGYGRNVAQGAELGIDAGARNVQDATDEMAPKPARGEVGMGARAARTPAPVINLTGDITIQVGSEAQAKDTLAAFKSNLVELLRAAAAEAALA